MFGLMRNGLSVLVMVGIMMGAQPAITGTMGQALGAYAELADSIIVYDESGNIGLNGAKADVMLADLGEGAEKVTTTLNTKANEFLNKTVEEAEVPEDAQAEFEEMKTTAEGWLNGINEVASLLVK